MKKITTFLMGLGVMFLAASCDKNCTAPALSTNIVGTWTAQNWALGSMAESGSVTFQSDGTLIDNSHIILDAEINGISTTEKTWAFVAPDSIRFRAATPPGPTSGVLTFTLAATINECNRIVFPVSLFGISGELRLVK